MYDPKFRVSDNLTDLQHQQIEEHERKMAMRKVSVEVKVKLVLELDEGVEVPEVVNEMEYDFTSTTDGATISDTTLEDFEVVDRN